MRALVFGTHLVLVELHSLRHVIDSTQLAMRHGEGFFSHSPLIPVNIQVGELRQKSEAGVSWFWFLLEVLSRRRGRNPSYVGGTLWHTPPEKVFETG